MTNKVGLMTLPLMDKTRTNWQGTAPRPMLSDIWYPAQEKSIETEILVGPPETPLFKAGRASLNAEIHTGRFPLVLLSHGTGGSVLTLGWLATHLARNGYIVVGVNHHGNTSLEPYLAEGFLYWWERAKDLSTVLDQLFDHPIFGGHIRDDQIGAAGFSLGATTVITLAGGIFDLDAFRALYQNTGRDMFKDVPPEFPDPQAFVDLLKKLLDNKSFSLESLKDSRIHSIFAIAPPLGEGFKQDGLSPIDIPVRIVVGGNDPLAPPPTNAAKFTSLIKGSELTILEDVGHYTFLAEGTEAGRQMLPDLLQDAPGIDRASIHKEVSEMARIFFNQTLVINKMTSSSCSFRPSSDY